MKIAVISANGRAGQQIVKEALARNLDVTAIARGENKSDAQKFLAKDLFDLTYEDLKDFDVIVDAFGTFNPDELDKHSSSLKHLSDILSQHDNRLIIVGGAGSLFTNPEHTQQLMDGADFPDAFKPLATAMGKALAELRTCNDVNWTYLSPAADFVADGARTGKYSLHGEEFSVNAKGESQISYADYAIALIDEAESGKHLHERISVIGE